MRSLLFHFCLICISQSVAFSWEAGQIIHLLLAEYSTVHNRMGNKWKRVVPRKIEIPASVLWKWQWQVRRWAWWRHGRAGKRRSPNKRTSPRIIPPDCEDSDLWKRIRCFFSFYWGFRIVFTEVYLTKTPSGCCGNPCMSVYLVLKLSAWYVLVKFLYSAETKHFDRLSFSKIGFLQKMTLMLDPGWLNHGLLPSDWKGSNLWTDEIESSHQSMTHQSLTTSNIVSYSFTAPQLIRWGLLVCCVGHYIAVKAHAGEI